MNWKSIVKAEIEYNQVLMFFPNQSFAKKNTNLEFSGFVLFVLGAWSIEDKEIREKYVGF